MTVADIGAEVARILKCGVQMLLHYPPPSNGIHRPERKQEQESCKPGQTCQTYSLDVEKGIRPACQPEPGDIAAVVELAVSRPHEALRRAMKLRAVRCMSPSIHDVTATADQSFGMMLKRDSSSVLRPTMPCFSSQGGGI